MPIYGYLLLFISLYFFNMVPAFMPPTWSVLAFITLTYHLAILPTVLIGATAATLGRLTLYGFARFLRPLLPKKLYVNFSDLGQLLTYKKKLTIPLLIFYAYLPIPSNQVFIAAGLAGFNPKILGACFFFGRLISYTFWVAVSHKLSDRISRPHGLILEILSLLIILAISLIPWGRLLPKKKHQGT